MQRQVPAYPASQVTVLTQQPDHCDCPQSHTLIGKLLSKHKHPHHHSHHHTPQVIGIPPQQAVILQPVQTPAYVAPHHVVVIEQPVHHHHRGR